MQSRIEIDPAAIDGLVQTIARLPDHDPINSALGLEITGQTLRLLARSSREDPWNAIAVEGAKVTGKEVRVFLNRHFLVKALRFGLTHIQLIDATAPLRFSNGAGKQMIVMPVRQDAPAARVASATSTESTATAKGSGSSNDAAPNSTPNPAASPAQAQPSLQPQPERKHTDMSEQNGTPANTTTNGSNGHGTGASRSGSTAEAAAGKPALEAALAQAEAVKGTFRDTISGLTRLSDLLRQAQREQKAVEKEIAGVRQTLRSLQSVRI